VTASVWDTIADEAAAESPLWEAAALPRPARDETGVFSPLGSSRFALALETIYEGYLLHYGRPRLFQPADGDTAVLLGDYLYAHGLVRLAAHGDVAAVADLAELISLCTQLRADGVSGGALDGVVWAATAARLGNGGAALDLARAAHRLERDPAPQTELARASSGDEAVERALAAHAALVE
jgi:hypothetical protein